MMLHEQSRVYTTFVTPFGTFQFQRVPFGLKNAPSYFQRSIEQILGHLLNGGICDVYIDDVIVFGENEHAFVTNLQKVLQRFKQSNIRLKADKCQLGLVQVEYLGHQISSRGVEIATSKKQGLIDLQPPTSKAEVHTFLGLCNWFSDFVQDLPSLLAPLRELLKKGVGFSWQEVHQLHFEKAKAAILAAPVLNHVSYDHPIVLWTDASEHGAGGVLYQVIDGARRYLGFVSKTFNSTQRRWTTIEQEGYAIMYCIDKFQHFL